MFKETGVEVTPETSCVSSIPQTLDSAQHIIRVINYIFGCFLAVEIMQHLIIRQFTAPGVSGVVTLSALTNQVAAALPVTTVRFDGHNV
jgi:hypothetical protein